MAHTTHSAGYHSPGYPQRETHMSDYTKFVGKKVIVTRNLDKPNEKGELAVEVEGTVEAANVHGVMLKPKGQVKPEILNLDEIEEIRFAPEKAKNIKAKVLKPIEHGQARGHLLERHGLTLKEVNALSEEEALEFHESIDHVAKDLGHVHGSKEETPAAEAVAAEESAA